MSNLSSLKEIVLSSGLFVPAYAVYRWSHREERERYLKEKKFYEELIKEGDLVFDVGANIGKKSEVFLKVGARVVAFEPQGDCLRELTARCAPWKKRLQTELSAVGEEIGEAVLHLRHQSTEQASLLADWEGTTLAEVRVPVTTLDAAIKTYGQPSFCKIDVEGYEYHVLKGLSQPIPLLSLEYHLHARELETLTACLERLATLGTLSINAFPAGASTWAFPEWLLYEQVRGTLSQRLLETTQAEYGDLFVRMA